jgi:hypothetical protein
MLISNLPYLNRISVRETVFGSASIEMDAYASAQGNGTYTQADTETLLRSNRRVTIARGSATAIAIGEETSADTNYHLNGFDFWKVKTKSHDGKYVSFEKTRVFAIDKPN